MPFDYSSNSPIPSQKRFSMAGSEKRPICAYAKILFVKCKAEDIFEVFLLGRAAARKIFNILDMGNKGR